MENLVGKWGWVSIDEIKSENFRKYLNPIIQSEIENLNMTDYVFQCMECLDNDYLKLKSTEVELILKMEAFRIMPEQPKFKPLEKVKFLNSKGFIEFGIVKKISWHNNEHKHIYLLEVNNKMKSRRYYAEDLESNNHN